MKCIVVQFIHTRNYQNYTLIRINADQFFFFQCAINFYKNKTGSAWNQNNSSLCFRCYCSYPVQNYTTSNYMRRCDFTLNPRTEKNMTLRFFLNNLKSITTLLLQILNNIIIILIFIVIEICNYKRNNL